MNKLLKLIFSCVVFTWSSAWAVDTYNPANGQLTIPAVQVGTTTFTNVVITVGSIVSVGNGSASGQVDTYDSKTNQLTIPSVVVGSTTYNNVVITVGSVVSVGSNTSEMTLISETFASNTVMPLASACNYMGGRNISPQLTISNMPSNTAKIALLMDDEVSPCGTGTNACIHWAVFNISKEKTSFTAGENLMPFGSYGQTVDGTSNGYFGPCPPNNHIYKLTAYALSSTMPVISAGVKLTRADFEAIYNNFIVSKTTIIGKYPQ